MNGGRYFVDSNVLLWRYDELNPAKRDQAKSWLAWLWENSCGAVSWQVLHDQAELSFWDGLIIAAAERTRCSFLLSEDFQVGRELGSITIVNPFIASPPVP